MVPQCTVTEKKAGKISWEFLSILTSSTVPQWFPVPGHPTLHPNTTGHVTEILLMATAEWFILSDLLLL